MRVVNYAKESYKELVQKVSWPTWSELQNSAILVMVASLIFAFIVLAMDMTFDNVMQFIYGWLY